LVKPIEVSLAVARLSRMPVSRFCRKARLLRSRWGGVPTRHGDGGVVGSTNRGKAIHRATIVFDLDGTIADTASDLIDAANAALIAEGLRPAAAEAIRRGVGYGAKAMLHAALASTGETADAACRERLAAQLVAHYEEHIAVKTRFFPGFLETARGLRQGGAKLALCTNKLERLMTRLLAALDATDLFDARAGRDTFPFHKPDPRHISELVSQAGGSLAYAIMVGDSEADVTAAKGARIPVFAVRFGYAAIPPEELGADAILDRYEELPALVEAFLPQKSRAPQDAL
jgi:phosphoglycolate phosphatase